jgi:hypothetical protein
MGFIPRLATPIQKHKNTQAPKVNKQGVCHVVALPFTLKRYLKAKRRIMKTQIIFHHAKI